MGDPSNDPSGGVLHAFFLVNQSGEIVTPRRLLCPFNFCRRSPQQGTRHGVFGFLSRTPQKGPQWSILYFVDPFFFSTRTNRFCPLGPIFFESQTPQVFQAVQFLRLVGIFARFTVEKVLYPSKAFPFSRFPCRVYPPVGFFRTQCPFSFLFAELFGSRVPNTPDL